MCGNPSLFRLLEWHPLPGSKGPIQSRRIPTQKSGRTGKCLDGLEPGFGQGDLPFHGNGLGKAVGLKGMG